MQIRITKVAEVLFMAPGSGLTDAQQVKRRAELIAELYNLCPHAKALTGSTLDTRIEERTTGVVLEYRLNEIAQIGLPFNGVVGIPFVGVGHDMFANDVTQLTRQLHGARELIRTAINPAISLDVLREKSAIGDQIKSIRRRLRKRALFHVPDVELDAEGFDRYSLRHIGPPIAVTIVGNVTALFVRSVELTDATMTGAIPAQLVGSKIPARILMSRRSARKNSPAFLNFAKHLDSSRTIKLDVGVNLDSVTGCAVSLNFIKFHK